MCGRTGRPAERCTGTCGTAARSATRAPGGRRAAAPGRVDIAERPGIVEEKSRVGDWEGDTGARHRGAVLSLVDRASKFTLLALLGGRTAGETGEAMRKRLGPYKEFVRTTDNGKEFAACREIAKARVVLLRAAVPGPERARERASSTVQGDRFSQPRRTAWKTCSTTGRARRWTTGLPRKFSSRGLTGGPAPPRRNPARLSARPGYPPGPRGRPAPCARAAGLLRRAVRGGGAAPARVSGSQAAFGNRRRPGPDRASARGDRATPQRLQKRSAKLSPPSNSPLPLPRAAYPSAADSA